MRSVTLDTNGHRSSPHSEFYHSIALTARVMQALVPSDDSRNRPAPSNSVTPPYVTAQPEVTYRKISQTNDGEELKFVVLATDGRKSCADSANIKSGTVSPPRKPHS